MQKLNIPDIVETPAEQVVAINDDTVIDSVFFLQCLVREVERREAVNARKGEQRDVHAFGYDIKVPREDVYLAREDGMVVHDVDGLTLLLNEVSEVELIPDYTGKGADKLLVFQLRSACGVVCKRRGNTSGGFTRKGCAGQSAVGSPNSAEETWRVFYH